jgi:hypothetical protein
VSEYVCFATGLPFRTRRSAIRKSSNNLLAVEPETENDIARKLFPRLVMIFSTEAATIRNNDKDLFK